MRYRQRTVLNAMIRSVMRAGKRIRDARCALIARVKWSYGINRGGCDVAYLQTLRPYVLERVVYQMR